jgi:hypothetical protein
MQRVLLLLGLTGCAGNAQLFVPDAELTVAAIALSDELRTFPHPDIVSVARLMTWQERPTPAASDQWVASFAPFGSSPSRQRLLPLARQFWAANASPRYVSAFDLPGLGRLVTREKPGAGVHYTVSRVALSAGGDTAMVGLESECPGMCGDWMLWLYVRSEAGWHREENLQVHYH